MAKRTRDRGIQELESESTAKSDKSTNTVDSFLKQQSKNDGSYDRSTKSGKMNHRKLLDTIVISKHAAIKWCMENKLIKSSMMCDKCKRRNETFGRQDTPRARTGRKIDKNIAKKRV